MKIVATGKLTDEQQASLELPKKLSVRKYAVAEIFVALCVFALTLLIAPYYVGGDQRTYIAVYEKLSNLAFQEGFELYTRTLTSQEYVHYSVIWLTSGFGIEKNLVMAVSNAFLAYFSMRLLEKWKVSIFVAITIVLTNYYMLVLYFAAERLKFGFLFLVVSMLYIRKNNRFFMLAGLSIFAHAQMLMLYASMLFTQMSMFVARFFKTLQFSVKKTFVFVIILAPIAFFLAEYILLKTTKYATGNALGVGVGVKIDFTRIVLLLILSLWYSKNKTETILLFIPLVIAVSVVGGDRVNMMAYFVFLYYGLQCKGGLNLGVLATTAYFAWKSYGFVADIIKYGDGFETMITQLHMGARVVFV